MSIRILKAPRCRLGESPNYVRKSNSAWWVDILGRRLFAACLDADRVDAHALPFMASAIATIDDGHHLLAAEDGLYVRRMSDGHLTRHCPLEENDARTRSNDGRVHPSGALWISTMGRDAEPGFGSIYHVVGGLVTRLYTGLTIPNAICFSPDGRTAYFVDSADSLLKRVPVDPRTGYPIGDPSIFYDQSGGTGLIDGAAVDAGGGVWSARWGAGCIDAYTPDGRRVRTVALPACQSTCPTFAGPELDRLLVTSAYEGMDEAAKRADPHHGLTCLVDVGVAGVLAPSYRMSR